MQAANALDVCHHVFVMVPAWSRPELPLHSRLLSCGSQALRSRPACKAAALPVTPVNPSYINCWFAAAGAIDSLYRSTTRALASMQQQQPSSPTRRRRAPPVEVDMTLVV